MDKLYVYAHTHWDREWYQPFESFRVQLVSVVRTILDELEAGRLPKFYLDGQSIIFEDVLAVAPELRARLQSAMQSGKLYAGPWYVLADQMLVGGESLVRNLAVGLKQTSEFGEPALVGYCPDTFGHTQDLPRILNGFGIRTASMWRGAPVLEGGPLFWWFSPDGSRVLTYHLTKGYYQTGVHELPSRNGNGGSNGRSPLSDYIIDWTYAGATVNGAVIAPYWEKLGGALMPIGGDHMGPPLGLTSIIDDLNDCMTVSSGRPLELVPLGLTDFLARTEAIISDNPESIVSVHGELRENNSAPVYERGYLLYGVLSTRLYIKRANRLAERRLGRVLEPMVSLLAARKVGEYPADQLDHAWKLLMKNHPHDSICGCSVDSVHAEMLTRFAQLENMTNTLMFAASARAAGSDASAPVSHQDPDFDANSVKVFHFGSSSIQAPVRMKWYEPAGSVVAVGARLASPAKPKTSSAEKSQAVIRASEKTTARCMANPDRWQVESHRSVDKLFSGWGTVPYYKQVEECEGWFWPGELPAFGSKSVPLNSSSDDKTEPTRVVVGAQKITNGLLEIQIKRGALVVNAKRTAGRSKEFTLRPRFVDVADVGDSYNFDPIPGDDGITAKFVGATVGKQGPLVGSIILEHEIAIPQRAEKGRGPKDETLGKIEPMKRSSRIIRHTITTEITLKRGVPILFFETRFDNKSSDHRLEVVFETGSRVTKTFSENHFSLVERNHRKAKPAKLPVPLAREAEPDRFPCQRFFIANGQLFLNTGAPEYGVRDEGVSITLLRAISWLSKPRLWTRGGGAGPNVEVPEANCLGPSRTSYGWAPLDDARTWPEQAYALAELYEDLIYGTLAKDEGDASLAPMGDAGGTDSLITIDNPAIRVMAAYVAEKNLFVRLLNVTGAPQAVTVSVSEGLFSDAAQVRLDETLERQVSLNGPGVDLNFGKNELLTLRLTMC